MKQQLAEIDAIANSSEKPTFENTVIAMENSGRMLDRATSAFFGVVQANTNPTLDKVQSDEAPKLSDHSDAIFLNNKLFLRVKAVYDARDTLKLDPESMRLLNVYYNQFVHAGALLSEADKTKLRELNKRDATLSTDFQQKLIAGSKAAAFVTANKADLAGLSDEEIAAAAKGAEERKMPGQYVIPQQNTTQQPVLASLTDRSVREKIFNNSWTRSEKGDANDTLFRYPATRATSRAKGEAARLSELGGLRPLRPDGEDAAGRTEIHWRPRACHRRQGRGRGQGNPGDYRQIRQAFRSQAAWDWEMYSGQGPARPNTISTRTAS